MTARWIGFWRAWKCTPSDRVTTAQVEALTGGNRNTIKVRLGALVKAGILARCGQGRATWYALP